MAKTPTYLKINSFSKEDTEAMFNAICEKALNISPRTAKKVALKLKGSNKELDEFTPTLLSVLTLIANYDIKAELKVVFVAEDGEKEAIPMVTKSEPLKSSMESQESEINDNDLKPEKKTIVVEPVVESQERGVDGPPDFE